MFYLISIFSLVKSIFITLQKTFFVYFDIST